MKYVLGCDLGQVNDYTALAIIERIERGKGERFDYHLRHLERVPLRTPYPEIIERVAGLLAVKPLKDSTKALVVDATGVGAPVIDMFKDNDLKPIAITITGGDRVTREGPSFRVPKRDLVSSLNVLLETQRLKIADALPFREELIEEMQNFKVKIDTHTAHDTYEAWRESIHDDLVLAVAMACWYADRPRKRAKVIVSSRVYSHGPSPPMKGRDAFGRPTGDE